MPKAQAPATSTPVAWTCSCWTNPRPVPSSAGSPNRATASVPQMPATRCTGTAPIASSMRSRPSSRVASTMSQAPAAPIARDSALDTTWQPAVIATRPASTPFIGVTARSR